MDGVTIPSSALGCQQQIMVDASDDVTNETPPPWSSPAGGGRRRVVGQCYWRRSLDGSLATWLPVSSQQVF